MPPDPLDDLLQAYSRQPLPPPPPPVDLRAAVWREVALRRRPFWSRVFPSLAWGDLFREPRLALSALGVAVLIGVVPVALAEAATSPQLARDSLHFDVFSTRSPGLPSTLLGRELLERKVSAQR